MLRRKILYIALGLLTQDYCATNLDVLDDLAEADLFEYNITDVEPKDNIESPNKRLNNSKEKITNKKQKVININQLNPAKMSIPSDTIEGYEYVAVQNIIDLLIDNGSDEAAKEAVALLKCLKDKKDNPSIKNDITFCIGVLCYNDTFRPLASELMDQGYTIYDKPEALNLIKSIKENNLFAQNYLDNLRDTDV